MVSSSERGGFEPPDPGLPGQLLSREPDSASLAPLQSNMAEREGFEPPVTCATAAFKAATLNHSDISPMSLATTSQRLIILIVAIFVNLFVGIFCCKYTILRYTTIYPRGFQAFQSCASCPWTGYLHEAFKCFVERACRGRGGCPVPYFLADAPGLYEPCLPQQPQVMRYRRTGHPCDRC